MQNIVMQPIGRVCNDVKEKKDHSWGEELSTIVLEEAYRPGLVGLMDFSHAIILTYLDKARYEPQKHLQRRPQNRADMPLTGIFAQRAKDRPNPIGLTAVEIISADEQSLTVRGLDAVDGTPVLDIKPYYPIYDRKHATVSPWVDRLMADYF